MCNCVKKKLRVLLFAAAGALVGLGYYYLFGCSGNCAVTASPWMTMFYVGIIGALLSGVIPAKEV